MRKCVMPYANNKGADQPALTCNMRGSRNFCQGGPGQSDKKALMTFFILVLSLFY